MRVSCQLCGVLFLSVPLLIFVDVKEYVGVEDVAKIGGSLYRSPFCRGISHGNDRPAVEFLGRTSVALPFCSQFGHLLQRHVIHAIYRY